MKKIKLIIALGLIVSILAGLGACERKSKAIELDFTTIGKGALSGNGAENITPQNTVISNSNDWQMLIAAMDSYNNVSRSFSEINIDFNVYMVVVVIDAIRPHSGYSIQIINIEEPTNNTNITVEYNQKNEGYTVVCQPFHIVRIHKTNKNIVFLNQTI